MPLNGLILSLAVAGMTAASPVAIVHHALEVEPFPEQHRLRVTDTVTLPSDGTAGLGFHLHEGLSPRSLTPGVEIERAPEENGNEGEERFHVHLPPGVRTFTLGYEGPIHHPLQQWGTEQARGFRHTPGIISEDGVYLAGSSSWYPRFNDGLVGFSMTVRLPSGWDAVSQGIRTTGGSDTDGTVVWDARLPQDEIYLVAGPFVRYERSAGGVRAMAFLRTKDDALASRYLDATIQYIGMYERMIGDYPYPKFALVENFWETGWGMPSFTLLGPKIIRFPFILHSSYPHEILHNWWGNGVYPDYQQGNWSEGLTAYLADHLIKEQRGTGVEHRQQVLQKYADYVSAGRDFPLSRFRSRHSSPSEAVGYGKALMFFHMLRRDLGDDTFVRGLREFYHAYRFRTATYGDLRKRFEDVSSRDLSREFSQWIDRSGAPELRVVSARAERNGDGSRLALSLEQSQAADPYLLRVPVAVTMEGRDRAHQENLYLTDRKAEFHLDLPSRPLRVDVDPEFDLFRRLSPEEMPPAISLVLGSKHMTVILPSAGGSDLREGYRGLAEMLAGAGPDLTSITDDEDARTLPAAGAVAVLGWENRLREEALGSIEGYGGRVSDETVHLDGISLPRVGHSVVMTGRIDGDPDRPVMWIAADRVEAMPGLGRKLPHYHKYSYLGFEGTEPTNVAKGRWPVVDSPMTVFVPGDDGRKVSVPRAELAPRPALAELPPLFSEERMLETVRYLSAPERGGRGFGSAGLAQAADYLAGRFAAAGLQPGGDPDEGYFQTWTETGGEDDGPRMLRNVIGVIPGTDPAMTGQSLVVAAHYDHLGRGWPEVREERFRGAIHPGADDNASGVAVLAELAEVMGSALKPRRTVIFVGFAGEEAGRLGSRYYVANEATFPKDRCIGMLNLDTVGRLGTGKLLVLGGESAAEWVHIFRGAGYMTGITTEMVPTPLDTSDHISFHEAGVPAVQLFTGAHPDYHRPTDTADGIDAAGLVGVASVAKEVVEYLADRSEALTISLPTGAGPAEDFETGNGRGDGREPRKVRLGAIPDFAFPGPGCRLAGVLPDSPAALSGLRTGDVILSVGDDPVNDLRDLSRILRGLQAGERVRIVYRRDAEEQRTEATVVAK